MARNRAERRKEKKHDQAQNSPLLRQRLFSEALQLHRAGRIADAEPLYRRLLALDPNHAGVLNLLGVISSQKGRPDVAVQLISRAIALNDDDAVFHNNLASAHKDLGNLSDAEKHYRQALDLDPKYADALSNLGSVLQARGRLDDAMDCYRRSLLMNPEHSGAHFKIGSLFREQGRLDDAEKFLRRVCVLEPRFADAHLYLGRVLQDQTRFDDAIVEYNKALALNPLSAPTYNNLGSVALAQGKAEEGIKYFSRAVDLSPDFALIFSNLLLIMVYAASVSPEMLADVAREFGKRVESLNKPRAFANTRDPERRLRIGYVSPDFRGHAVNYFFEPLLDLQDREKFDIFCYSNVPLEDEVTARLRTKADHWRNIWTMSDDETVAAIESDGIDILVDLAGHTGNNRLMVFARKPAPIQVTWLGFPATTGVMAMDYRITDSHAEPIGVTEHLSVEKLWRMPEIFCCYQPHENSPAVIGHPPFEDYGHITFGCFNNFAKVTDPVLEAWAKIMAQVPDSRLLLEIKGIDGGRFRAETIERMKRLGLPVERVDMVPRRPENQFVLYNRVDIALDPFPCVGGTTSFDSLWMGVPFVTLAGQSFVSRMGVSILNNAGMPELIAQNIYDYINLAVGLAQDRARLRNLRHGLRDRVAASPLMDQRAFTHHMEDAFLQMWHRWCAQIETPA